MKPCGVAGCTLPGGRIGLCSRHYRSKYYGDHKEKIAQQCAQYYLAHKNAALEKARIYRENNKEIVAQRKLDWQKKHRTKMAASNKRYRDSHKAQISNYLAIHKDLISLRHRKYMVRRRGQDIGFRLSSCLRGRLCSALRRYLGGSKVVSAVRDLGCSMPEFASYLEKRFEPGMSWDNYGNKLGCWSIDHVRPLASFDLSDKDQSLQAVHYTNLQPLWHLDNIKKSDKLPQIEVGLLPTGA